MIASREEELQKLMDKVNATAKQYDMRINVKKNKVMKVTKERLKRKLQEKDRAK